jgi:hypothetical protein
MIQLPETGATVTRAFGPAHGLLQNRSWLHHRTERLKEIHTWALGETPKNPTCLVPLECPVCIELVLENPFARHHVGMMWSRHEIPSVVLQKGSMLFLHGGAPTRVSETTTVGLGHRGELCSMEQSRNAKAALGARRPPVLVGHWLDSNNTLGKRRWGRCGRCRNRICASPTRLDIGDDARRSLEGWEARRWAARGGAWEHLRRGKCWRDAVRARRRSWR